MSSLALGARDQDDAFGNGNSEDDADMEDRGGVVVFDEYEGLDSDNEESEKENDEGEIGADDENVAAAASRRPQRNTLETATRIREITDPAERTTRPFMTIFERAAVIGERATRIEQGEEDIDQRVIDLCEKYNITVALDIAEIELESVAVPFPMVVKRRIERGVVEIYEVWNVRELTLPSQVLCLFAPPGERAPRGASSKELCPSSVLRMIISRAAKISADADIDISAEDDGNVGNGED